MKDTVTLADAFGQKSMRWGVIDTCGTESKFLSRFLLDLQHKSKTFNQNVCKL